MVDFGNACGIMVCMEPSNDNSFGSFSSPTGGDGGVAMGGDAGAASTGGVTPSGMMSGGGVVSGDGLVSGVNNAMPSGNAAPVINGGTPMGSAMPVDSGMQMNYMMPGSNGAQMNYAMPLSSGTGDIVIGDTGKKRKKWWVIGGIAGLVLVIIIIVIVLLSGGLLNWKGVFSGGLKSSFNKFANYVVNGTDSVDDIGEKYSVSNSYYFVTNQKTEEEQKLLYNDTSELLREFVNTYLNANKSEIKQEELLTSSIEDEDQLLEFMKVVYTKKPISNADITSLYVEKGSGVKSDELDQYYDFTGLKENKYASGFQSVLDSYISSWIAILGTYQSSGCLDKYIDYVCVNNIADEAVVAKIESYDEEMRNAMSDLQFYYGRTDDFVANVFIINALLNNRSIESTNTVTGGNNAE